MHIHIQGASTLKLDSLLVRLLLALTFTRADAGHQYDIAQVAKRNWGLAVNAAASDKKRAAAAASTVSGSGLTTSIVRQLGVFQIHAHDHEGNKRLTGGEAVAVAVRGTSNVVRRRSLSLTFACEPAAPDCEPYAQRRKAAVELLRSPI